MIEILQFAAASWWNLFVTVVVFSLIAGCVASARGIVRVVSMRA